MKAIEYKIEEVHDISGRPYRLGFLLADMRKPREIDKIVFRHRYKTGFIFTSVFHYTSLAGLQGIIKDEGFWASDNRFMNDTEEFGHGVEVALKVLTHAIRRTRNPQFAEVLTAVQIQLSARPAEGNLIACFSLSEDSLEQWRGYGSSGGVCIEVGDLGDAEGMRPAFYGPDMLPQRVVYDDRSKAILVLQEVRLLEDEYNRDRRVMWDQWPDDHDTEYCNRLTSRLLFLVALFKGSAFGREEEVRIVFSYSNADRFEGIDFRASPLGLIPYLNTGKRQGMKGKLPIRKVVVGPSPHQATILQSVRTFMDHKGYQNTPVLLSRVPFRSY